MSQKTKVILRTITTIFVFLALAFAFLVSAVRLFGVDIYGVLTGSMEPSYPVGSLIYVKKVDPNELRVRDVITFSMTANTVVTHRIVEIVPDETNPNIKRFRTQGDANNAPDVALVNPANVVGKVVFCLPQLGNIANYVQHPPGTYVAIALGILLIVIVFVTDSVTSSKDGKEEKRIQMPWLSALLAKVGITWPKQNPDAAPARSAYYPGGQYTGQPQYPSQQQYPVQPQYPPQPQYPAQPQYPPQPQYSPQPQYPARPQYQPQQQYPAQPQYQPQPQYTPQPQYSPQQPQYPAPSRYPQQPQQYPPQPRYPQQPQQYPSQAPQYQQPQQPRYSGQPSYQPPRSYPTQLGQPDQAPRRRRSDRNG